MLKLRAWIKEVQAAQDEKIRRLVRSHLPMLLVVRDFSAPSDGKKFTVTQNRVMTRVCGQVNPVPLVDLWKELGGKWAKQWRQEKDGTITMTP
ncbi:MAG: hypothetical protein PHR51_01270 [Patescibacteria group bacterium]|nr:hypothetical protein [Patescibacteria group bacterium]